METTGINNKSRSTHGRLFLLVLLVMIAGRTVAQDNAALIRNSFGQLKNAFKSLNGKQAADLVDRTTLEYYYHVFKEARSLDSIRVERLPAYEKALVFDLRLHADAALTAGDARACFIAALENGWMTRWGTLTTMGSVDMGDIALGKDTAIVSLLLGDTKMPYRLKFRYETSQWKADLTTFCSFTSQMYTVLAQNMKISETKAVLFMMGNQPNDKPDPTIWKPLLIK